jgi:hypothetical protein
MLFASCCVSVSIAVGSGVAAEAGPATLVFDHPTVTALANTVSAPALTAS